jgi:hypothetical protein
MYTIGGDEPVQTTLHATLWHEACLIGGQKVASCPRAGKKRKARDEKKKGENKAKNGV